MTTDEAMLAGRQFVRDHLRIIDVAHGSAVMMAYAAGMASGLLFEIARRFSVRAAFDLFTGLADDLLDQVMKMDDAA
jgi:hypothetical protein